MIIKVRAESGTIFLLNDKISMQKIVYDCQKMYPDITILSTHDDDHICL